MKPAQRASLALAALLTGLVSASAGAADLRRSGFADMAPSTQALQRDDTLNPAMLWVQDGEQRFQADCAGCHGSGSAPAMSLRGAAARHPAWDTTLGKPLTLAGRINQCRVRHVKAPPLAPESEGLLALEAFVALQSRGLPTAPDRTPALQPFVAQGEALYRRRIGQLDFSCAQCHDDHAGRRLASALIPQAHPTGYPLYRLEWQGLGSLQRRLRNCMTGVRAEPYAYGSDEYTMIELYLKQRAAGMAMESPAVRP
ncbi:sulfur oxidation c-type cytochrome SoxA [beta proteobacterium AAP121]|nr:sulfur oxidation c-type cytochrome SoxA [beta proteobacterium AAP65]KPG00666.1 sulfur oxidation c-type cytochrome SoxA [beta proteobacterium AAP121]